MNASRPSFMTGAERERLRHTLKTAMQEVFELMLAYSLESPSKVPSIKGLDVISIVGLSGQLQGSVTLCCSARSAASMASRMLGIDSKRIGPEMEDAVGEVCNMVAGNFKNKIGSAGDNSMLSAPTVITGADYEIHAVSEEDMYMIFLFEGEPVILSLEIHS